VPGGRPLLTSPRGRDLALMAREKRGRRNHISHFIPESRCNILLTTTLLHLKAWYPDGRISVTHRAFVFKEGFAQRVVFFLPCFKAFLDSPLLVLDFSILRVGVVRFILGQVFWNGGILCCP